jgi:hypothetical protein
VAGQGATLLDGDGRVIGSWEQTDGARTHRPDEADGSSGEPEATSPEVLRLSLRGPSWCDRVLTPRSSAGMSSCCWSPGCVGGSCFGASGGRADHVRLVDAPRPGAGRHPDQGHRRTDQLLERGCDGVLRILRGGGPGNGLLRAAGDEVPGAPCRDRGPAAADRTVGGRAGADPQGWLGGRRLQPMGRANRCPGEGRSGPCDQHRRHRSEGGCTGPRSRRRRPS